MKFKAVICPGDLTGETLVLAAWAEGPVTFSLADTSIDMIRRLWAKKVFEGRAEEIKVIYDQGPWERIILLGLGEQGSFSTEGARNCGAALAKALRGIESKDVWVLGELATPEISTGTVFQAFTEGLILGDYSFEQYKRQKSKTDFEHEINFLVTQEQLPEVSRLLGKGMALAEATNMARDLVNQPGNKLTPVLLAECCRIEAGRAGMACQVLGQEEIEILGMGGLAGVSSGSSEPAQLIVLKYSGKGRSKPLGLVGKGITFDSGGISLKSAGSMEEMKSDMAGGAAVIGAMTAMARLKVPLDVIGIIPAAENLPSGSAVKPGDVISMLDGSTVEIISTDSEGRLILADAIVYGVRMGCDPIVDVATLTGACSVALGPSYSGLWANHKSLRDNVLECARRAGEKVWPMPLDDEYYNRIRGSVADLKNSGGREGGASAAAAFLGCFAGEKPWAHLDIAPTAWADKGKGYIKKGGTGVMVRTLVELAILLAEQMAET